MKELSQALAASEQGLTQVLEALPVGVVIIDSTGKVSYTNQMGKNLLGKDVIRCVMLPLERTLRAKLYPGLCLIPAVLLPIARLVEFLVLPLLLV